MHLPGIVALAVVVSVASIVSAAPKAAVDAKAALADDVRARCVKELEMALVSERPWVGIHAGESLALLGKPEPVLAAFRPKADTAGPQYRIGVWRVLALAEPARERRAEYVERIRKAFLDPRGEDRLHAVEALEKLNARLVRNSEEWNAVRAFADQGGPAAPFAIWRLVQAGDTTAVARLESLLGDPDEVTRLRAAYALGRLPRGTPITPGVLAGAWAKEPPGTVAYSIIWASLGVDAARDMIKLPDAPQHARYAGAMGLAERGTPRDFAVLEKLLDDADQDVRVAASYALLQIEARATAAATRPARGGGKAE